MPRGGARPGAGRKPRAEKYARPITRAEKKIADKLPELVDNLLKLAKGGYERIVERWVPAGTVKDEEGLLVFPNLPATEMVLIQRQREHADSDRAANIYLLDRIIGKPVAMVEADVTSGGKSIQQVVFYLPDNGRDGADNADRPAAGSTGDLPLDAG